LFKNLEKNDDVDVEGNPEAADELTASGAMISKTLRELEKEIKLRGKLEARLHKKKLHGLLDADREPEEDAEPVRKSLEKNNAKRELGKLGKARDSVQELQAFFSGREGVDRSHKFMEFVNMLSGPFKNVEN
jgi:hypothetical protein